MARLCLTLHNPMHCSPPGSSVLGILQARILEWVAMTFSRGSSQPRDRTQVSCIAGGLLTVWAIWEAPKELVGFNSKDREGNGNQLQYSCLENPMGRGAWWAAVHGVAKSWKWLNELPFTFHFHALKKKMATHSSVLAWRVPETREPDGLPSMGSHRVGHDWSYLAAAAAAQKNYMSFI